MDTVDLLVVGKTGNGKSALGNSILRRKAFQSRNSTMSVTKTAEFDFSEFEGRIIKVVDGPGVGDTDLDPQEAAKLVVEAMSNVICANTQGFHAILVVVRYGGRFTKEDMDTLVILKQIFGEKFISNHAILVMTGGDNFKKDAAGSGETFENWCAEQSGVFRQLFTGVRKRAVIFDNKTKNEKIIYDQLQRLLAVVDSLGARYTSEAFEDARKTRENVLSAEKCPTLNEDSIREAGLITQKIGQVNSNNPKEGISQLEQLMKRTHVLLQNIQKQDQGTNSFSAALKMVQMIKGTITELLEEMGTIPSGKQETGFERKEKTRVEESDLDKGETRKEAEVKNIATTGVKLQALRLEKEMMEKERHESVRRDWQRRQTDRKREAEKRAEEREHKEDQMTIRERRKEARELEKQQELVMAHLDNVIQEKVSVLEDEYKEVKDTTRADWLKASPRLFVKFWAKVSNLWRGKSQE